MSTRVVLIRHGDTPASKDERFAESADVPLSAEGRAHASALATRLARVPLAAIYASSMQRAMDTAGYIAAVHALRVTPVDDLREIAHGVWGGLTVDEVRTQDPEGYAAYTRDPFDFAPREGESGSAVLQRAAPALLALVRAHPDQSIAVVAHKTTNRLLIAHCVGIDPHLYRERLAQRPACINLLEFRTPSDVQLVLLNDISHYAMTPAADYPYTL